MKSRSKKKKRQKREAILESAKVVFSKKGLIDATMQDIIEECGISRGGIYLYFQSVDAIFLEVLQQRSQRRFNEVRAMIKANASFETILTKYFEDHKYRLLHSISDSMLRATYEYYYTHKSVETSSLQQTQLTGDETHDPRDFSSWSCTRRDCRSESGSNRRELYVCYRRSGYFSFDGSYSRRTNRSSNSSDANTVAVPIKVFRSCDRR